jgi:hypothetical protein
VGTVEHEAGDVGASALPAVRDELTGLAADFVDLDLARVALAGWRKHRDLVAAARRTRAYGRQESVQLGRHEMVLTRRPSVDVLVGEQRIRTINFELAVTITVIDLEAVVRQGRLVELRRGRCPIKVSFSVDGVVLAEREVEMDPELGISLRSGVDLGAGTRLPRQRDGRHS